MNDGFIDNNDLYAGAQNLLINCAELREGDKVLILHEDPTLGWYDLQAPEAVAQTARQLGIQASLQQVSGPTNQPNPDLLKAWETHNNIICFARIGDQDRFAETEPDKKLVMCYVRDAKILASRYGSTNHRAFKDVKQAINKVLLGANRIEISCPLGTELRGELSSQAAKIEKDVSVLRFPMAVPQPVEAMDFSGKVVLKGYITSTGSKVYNPDVIKIDKPVSAIVEHGRIKIFSGESEEASKVQTHYQHVARQFNIDADVVHSWHAGIHPGCSFYAKIDDNPDLWSNSIFGNPRYLHFHTCGDYAPGEISWMILDHTITVDGTNLWDHGRLKLENFELTQQCLNDWPELADLFTNPSDSIGV